MPSFKTSGSDCMLQIQKGEQLLVLQRVCPFHLVKQSLSIYNMMICTYSVTIFCEGKQPQNQFNLFLHGMASQLELHRSLLFSGTPSDKTGLASLIYTLLNCQSSLNQIRGVSINFSWKRVSWLPGPRFLIMLVALASVNSLNVLMLRVLAQQDDVSNDTYSVVGT